MADDNQEAIVETIPELTRVGRGSLLLGLRLDGLSTARYPALRASA